MKLLKILGAVLLMGTAYAGQSESIKEAENVAVLYMTAHFSIEMDKAADLTHPQAIENFYNIFNQELEKAIQNSSEEEFLIQNGINIGISELKSMNPRDLYIYVVASYNMKAPEKARRMMKQTKISVLRSETIDSESANVFLRFINSEATPSEYTGGLLLKIYNSEWKVVSSIPN